MFEHASTVIAICALALTVWQGIQTRKHNRLSCKPFLTTWIDKDLKNNSYSVDLINNGLGPAVIENFAIKVDDELFPIESADDVSCLLKKFLNGCEFNSRQSYVGCGYIMAAKERVNIVSVQILRSNVLENRDIENLIERSSIEIVYTSLYKDKFFLSSAKL